MTARQIMSPEFDLKTVGSAMKTLVSVAVFGLLPVPPIPDPWSSSSYSRRSERGDHPFSQFAHPIGERTATKEELARISYELEEIAAKPGRVTKGPWHNPAGAPAALSQETWKDGGASPFERIASPRTGVCLTREVLCAHANWDPTQELGLVSS